MDHMHAAEGTPSSTNHVHDHYTHMTFFWSKNAEILFSGWPGSRTGMYVLALLLVFVLSILVEWLSHYSQWIKKDTSNVKAGLIQTICHGVKMALAYLVMLAVMSFNVGVFVVSVSGHIIGFLVFGTKIFKRAQSF